MDFSISFNEQPKYVIVVGHGKAIPSDFKEVLEALIAHPEFESGMNALHDYSDVDVSDLTAEDINDFAQMVSLHREPFANGKWAFLMRDVLGFGIARMWYGFVLGRADIQPEAFIKKDEAIAWMVET